MKNGWFTVQKSEKIGAKVEVELKDYRQHLIEAVDSAGRKAGIERLVKLGEKAMTRAFGKHKQLYSFADNTTDSNALKNDLESWLSDVAVENDEVLKKARGYIDGLPETNRLLSLPLKPLRKPSLFPRLPKRPLPEFLMHQASDNGSFSLQNTDAGRFNDRTKV